MITPAPDQPTPVDHAQWFAHEVRPHEPALRSYLRGTFPGVRDVDDVVQESYARLWRRQVREPIKSGRAFLFTIARRLVFDLLRHQRRSPIEAVEDVEGLGVQDARPAVTDRLAQGEKLALLVDAIDALPARCRDVVILRKLQLLSQREVAARLGISEKGVEIQLARGLARCRAYLQARDVHGLFDDAIR
jgi:RNA polymerase sigma-70 factor (ECF subfamily)